MSADEPIGTVSVNGLVVGRILRWEPRNAAALPPISEVSMVDADFVPGGLQTFELEIRLPERQPAAAQEDEE